MAQGSSRPARGRGVGVWALVALAAGALLMLCWPLLGGGWPGGMAGGMAGGMGPGMGAMMIGMALLWVALGLGLVALMRWAVGRPRASDAEPDALEIARRRYAGGEISREQFEQLRAELGR